MAEKETVNQVKKSVGKPLLWVLLLLLFGMVICIFLAALYAPFQTKLIKGYLSSLNEKMEETVSISTVSFHASKGVVINDLLILDFQSDTLLYAEKFYSGLSSSLLTLWNRELALSEVNLEGALIDINICGGDTKSNLDRFLENFIGTDSSGEKGKPLDLSLAGVHFKSVEGRYLDENIEKQILAYVEEFDLSIDTLDLQGQTVRVDQLIIKEPTFALSTQYKMPELNPAMRETSIATVVEDTLHKPWSLAVQRILIEDGKFKNTIKNKPAKVTTFKHIDYGNLEVERVDVELFNLSTNLSNSLEFENLVLGGHIPKDANNYALRCDKLVVLPDEASITKMNLTAGETIVNQSVSLAYDDFSSFETFVDDVFMNVNFEDSSISFKDVAYFLPNLSSTPLILKNYDKVVKISGIIKGRVNNFSSKAVHLNIANDIQFDGSVRIKDITNPDKTFLSINVERLNTSVLQLTNLIPAFNPPQNFYKLNKILFAGSFSGFVYDFVAKGSLISSLGNAVLDTRLDLKPGREKAKYSGKIDLINFDLRNWTDNDQFGFVTASSQVDNGQGLLLDYLNADLKASISSFDFNGYNYSNINLDGIFAQNQFDGDFKIKDDNIDFIFGGSLNVQNGIVTAEFEAFADKLDLQKLNLSKEELIIQGNFDLSLKGQNLTDFSGNANIGNLSIAYREKVYNLDSIYLKSIINPSGNRDLVIESNLIDLSLNGIFNPENFPYYFTSTFKRNHPQWWNKTTIKEASRKVFDIEDNFKFNLSIEDSQEFAELVDLSCLHITNLVANGKINTATDRWYIDTQVEKIECDDLVAIDVDYSLAYLGGRGKTKLDIGTYVVKEREFPKITLDGNLLNDSVSFNLITSEVFDSIGNINFMIVGYPLQNGDIYMHLESKTWQMLGSDWFFSDDNSIVLGKQRIEFNQFKFSDGERIISLTDIEKKGAKFTLQDFDMLLLNPIIDYSNIEFSGKGDISLLFDNLFDSEITWVEMVMQDLYLNGETYGKVYLNANTRNFEDVEGIVSIKRRFDDQNIVANFALNTKNKNFSALLESSNVNLTLFEYIIADGISNTEGTMDLVATIEGKLDNFRLEGEALLKNGTTRVDYLGNVIAFDNQKLRVTENIVDLTGVQLTDILGNKATIQGGLKHTYLKDFAADATLVSPKFVGLNTTKADNPDYYGLAIGAMDVNFNGPFSAVDITINATTSENTVFNIPVEGSATGYEESFITFVKKEDLIRSIVDTLDSRRINYLTGTNVELNLNVTPDAVVKIIFNEKLNDKIVAVGRGNLQVVAARSGDFDIFGNYEIESGEYLFTAWGFVAKPFTVNKGSLISWTGDPYNAILNISASYGNLKAPLSTFLQEYPILSGTTAYDEARKRTDVDLILALKGNLFSPQVSFDLNFPNVPSELRSYVDSKMNSLRQNDSELNDQVAGLLIFQNFIPSNNPLGQSFLNTNNLVQSGISTLSEFLSSQLSFQLSEILSQALVENGFLSSIDFDIGFANNQIFGVDGASENSGIIPSEIEVHLKPRFQNDRWGIDVGANFVRESYIGNDYTTNDFVVEYYITNDRRLKLRVYGKYDFDINFERVQKYGAGISYRKEFGSLIELREELDKELKKQKSKVQ